MLYLSSRHVLLSIDYQIFFLREVGDYRNFISLGVTGSISSIENIQTYWKLFLVNEISIISSLLHWVFQLIPFSHNSGLASQVGNDGKLGADSAPALWRLLTATVKLKTDNQPFHIRWIRDKLSIQIPSKYNWLKCETWEIKKETNYKNSLNWCNLPCDASRQNFITGTTGEPERWFLGEFFEFGNLQF